MGGLGKRVFTSRRDNTRVRYIVVKMDEWHPQTFRFLAVRPYRDPLSFYDWNCGYFGIGGGVVADDGGV